MSEKKGKFTRVDSPGEPGFATGNWNLEWRPAVVANSAQDNFLDQGYLCRLSIPTRPKDITQVCAYICSLCHELLTVESIERIQTALIEALTNAMIHGNLEVDSFYKKSGDWGRHNELIRHALNDPKRSVRRVILDIQLVDKKMVFAVEDEGPGFIASEFERLDPADILMSECGRGLMMIRFSMDEVSWNQRRNRITMVKYIA